MKNIFLLLIILFGIIAGKKNSNAHINQVKFDHIYQDQGLSNGVISSINQDKYHFMWFGTWNGLNKYDGYEFIVYKTDIHNPKSISNNRTLDIYLKPDGNLWILTFDSVYNRYNYQTDDFTRFPKSSLTKASIDSFNTIRTIDNTIIWKNFKYEIRDHVLYQVNLLNNSSIPFTYDPLDKYSLLNGSVYEIFLDKSNILWVGVDGIHKTNLDKKPFIHYKDLTTLRFSTRSNINYTRAIYEDTKGNLWVGSTSLGVIFLDRQTFISKHFMHSTSDMNSLANNQIRDIIGDSRGFIWFGTKGGADKYDPDSNRFYHYTTESVVNLPDSIVFSIVEDQKENLWFGTWSGIAKMNCNRDSIAHYDVQNNTLMSNSVRVVYCDKADNIWVGTQGGGLSKLKRDPNTIITNETLIPQHFIHNRKDTSTLSDNRVYSICQDSRGDMWIGTASGLDKLNEDDTFTHFNESHGLPDVMILGILSDGKNNLWFSHKKGISKININTYELRNYNMQDGLQANEFTEDAYYRNKSGEMFFGGVNGFNSFFPDSIKDSKHLPKIVFTGFQIMNKNVPIGKEVNGRVVLQKSLLLTDEIVLTYNDKIFTIEFAALQYANPSKNRYKYILENFEDEWIETDSRIRRATYSNLPPGTYQFKVKASNSDGVWNEEGTSIRIIINPPFWNTWGFRITGFLIIITSIIIGYKIRTARIRAHNRELEQHVKERTDQLEYTNRELEAFAYSVSHDLRAPLRGMNGFSQILLDEYANKLDKQGKDYLNRIQQGSWRMSNIIDSLLNLSHISRADLHMKKVNLSNLVKLIIREYEVIHHNKNIKFIIKDDIYTKADQSLLRVMLTNLIDNACKYSSKIPNPVIEFGTTIKNRRKVFYIRDNGIGFDMKYSDNLFEQFSRLHPGFEGTGIGLAIVQRIINRHNGSIWAESKINEGATFYFTINKKIK